MSKNSTEYSAEETNRRFEAALRGARLAGPKHNESINPKRVRPRQKKPKKKGAAK